MKNFKFKHILMGTLIAVTMCCTSCSDFLDVERYVYDKMTIDTVFSRKVYLEQYINGTAAYLPDESRLYTNSWSPFALATDENFASWDDARHAGMAVLLDEITPFSTYFNNWANFYKGIRKANLVLERIDECKDISDMERREYVGRAYFLRGYFYYLLLQQYGPVPIVPDQAFSVDAEVEDLQVERSTYDQCVEYISESMEKAYDYLPVQREAAFSYLPTQGAALSVISRVRLYAASPMFNGNSFYADWKRKDGEPFISQQEDNTKWGKAAVVAKRIIDMNTYSLHTIIRSEKTLPLPENTGDANFTSADFPGGARNIDPYLSYMGIFTGETYAINNPELIYYCNAMIGNDSPAWIATPYVLGGGNGLNATLDLVEAYKMKDGRDINNSSAEYPYPASDDAFNPIGTGYSFSGYYQMLPKVAKIDDNREPRYYASIGFNHCFWLGTAYTGSDNVQNFEITYYSNGTGMPPVTFVNDYNRTGYTCKKYIHPEDNLKSSSLLRRKAFPIFRYAEILLNYAEALNEMNGTYTDEAAGITVSRDVNEIRSAFNQIRYRAGLPGLSDEELSSQSKMREIIKRERQVEFAFEGRRYHDVRRWKDAPEVYAKTIRGLNVTAKSTERQKYYTPMFLTSENINKRIWHYKMNFYPIPRTVIDKNSKLIQNPGW